MKSVNIYRFQQFFALSSGSRKLFLQAWLALAGIDLGLRLISLPRLQSLLDGPLLFATDPVEQPDDYISRAARMVDLAARHHFGPKACLSRALALLWMLKRKGISASLRIGVRKVGDTLKAHAWLQNDDLSIEKSSDIINLYHVVL